MSIEKKHIVYVLQSLNHNFRYVGMTSDFNRRLRDHNSGKNRSTKHYAPFKLIYSEHCENSTEARRREKFFKSTRGREFLKDKMVNPVPAPTKSV